MQTIAETNGQMNAEAKKVTTVKARKLDLKREIIHNLNDQLLTSQGHSLWTCEVTGDRVPDQ